MRGAAGVGRSVCSGGGSTGRTIGVEEAAEVGGSVGVKEQRPDDRWGGGSRRGDAGSGEGVVGVGKSRHGVAKDCETRLPSASRPQETCPGVCV